MSNKCKLYYDPKCPICTNFVTVLKRKISNSDIIFVASTDNMKDFKFIDESGAEFSGHDAIKRMSARFPVLLDYFWMLPESLRVTGLQAAYKVGSVARKVLKTVTGCGCGK
jgi:glutaredoxin-related protein